MLEKQLVTITRQSRISLKTGLDSPFVYFPLSRQVFIHRIHKCPFVPLFREIPHVQGNLNYDNIPYRCFFVVTQKDTVIFSLYSSPVWLSSSSPSSPSSPSCALVTVPLTVSSQYTGCVTASSRLSPSRSRLFRSRKHIHFR